VRREALVDVCAGAGAGVFPKDSRGRERGGTKGSESWKEVMAGIDVDVDSEGAREDDEEEDDDEIDSMEMT